MPTTLLPDGTEYAPQTPGLDPAIAGIPFASATPAETEPQTNIIHVSPDQGPAIEQGGPAEPRIVAGTPTLAEIRDYNRINGIVNPVLDLNAEEIANLATEDPEHFNLEQSLLELQPNWDKETINKAADAWNLLERRGWKPAKDLGLSHLPGMAKDVVVGGASWLSSLAKGAVGVPAALAMEKIDEMMGLPPSPAAISQRQKLQREIGETAAATEASVTGLAFLGEKAYNKIFGKKPELKTQQEKIESLQAALIPHLAHKKISSGGGLVQSSPEVQAELAQAGLPIRPEEVEKKIAGDPVAFLMFGKGLEGVSGLLSVTKPAFRVVGKIPGVAKAAETIAAVSPEGVVGGGIELAGKVTRKTAPVTGKVATGLAVAGAIKATPLTLGQMVSGAILGRAGGLLRLHAIPELAGKVVSKLEKAGASIESTGKQIAGKEAAKGTVTQGVRDVLQSLPSATGEVAKGAALDLGLAALTSTTPEDQQGLQLGTIFGAAQGLRKTGSWVVSGQRIVERPWGSKGAVSSGGQLPVFDKMHNAAYSAATPAVRERINAVRQFLKGTGSNTDVFLADPTHTRTVIETVPDHLDLTSKKFSQEELAQNLIKTKQAERTINTDIEQALLESGLSAADAETYAKQNGMFIREMPVAGKPGEFRRAIVLAEADAAPHEAKHAFQDVLGEQANQVIDKVIRESYADQWEQIGREYTEKLLGRGLGSNESWRDFILEETGTGNADAFLKRQMEIANQISAATGMPANPADVAAMMPDSLQKGQWRDILSPEEAAAAADKYISREIAAENFDSIFKNLGASLKEKTGVIPWLAKVVASTTEMLGGDSLQGRKSTLGIQLNEDVIQAIKGQARDFVPEVTEKQPPATTKPSPLPSGSPAPITPEDRATAAENTLRIAQDASDTPVAGGTRSEKELLGEIAAAQAGGDAVKINYLSAPDEPAASITSRRDIRRQLIEMFRTMPQAARALWEKNFFPDQVRKTKKGKIQVGGWAPEVFAANAHKAAQVLSRLDPALSPYPIDPATKSFTEDGWKQLYEDTQKFVQNQMAGRAGSGVPLVVPREMEQAGFFKPPQQTGSGALEQRKADFISAMFGMKLPETPRMREGKVPLNVAGQEVSEATIPGRVEPAVRPRGTYEKAPVEGRDIAEVNPWRAEFERAAQSAGVPLPSTIEAFQWLNLENIKEVQHTPEQPQFRGNTLTLQAGFQPRPENPRAIKEAAIRTEDGKIFTGAIHADAFSKILEAGYDAGDLFDRMTWTDGFVTNAAKFDKNNNLVEGEFLNRADAFQRAAEIKQLPEGQLEMPGGGLEALRFGEVRQFSPQPKPEDEGLGKTFNTFITGAKAAILENNRDLAEGFLKQALGAADFQRTLARKGDVSEFGDKSIDAEFDKQMAAVNSIKAELKTIEDESKMFLEKGLAGRVFEAGGKLDKHPPFDSMEGTGFDSHAEIVEAAIERDMIPKGRRSQSLWRLAAEISDTGPRLTEIKEAARLISRSSILGKPGAMEVKGGVQTEDGFYSDEALAYSEKGAYNDLIKKISDIQYMKNSVRIERKYFGKRAPFSQLRKPKATQFSPQAKKEIELIGPDGKKYKARFDGYWDLTAMGQGHIPSITALEDLPGSLIKGSSGMSPTLEKAGYKLPGDLPAPPTETEAQFSPKKKKDKNIENRKGWLDPLGNFHLVDTTHEEFAMEKTGIDDYRKAGESLFKKGWVRVTPDYPGSILIESGKENLTRLQTSELKNWAIERGDINEIVHETPTDLKSVWSKEGFQTQFSPRKRKQSAEDLNREFDVLGPASAHIRFFDGWKKALAADKHLRELVKGTRLESDAGVSPEDSSSPRRVLGGNPENNFEVEIGDYIESRYPELISEAKEANRYYEELLTATEEEVVNRRLPIQQTNKEGFAIGKLVEEGFDAHEAQRFLADWRDEGHAEVQQANPALADWIDNELFGGSAQRNIAEGGAQFSPKKDEQPRVGLEFKKFFSDVTKGTFGKSTVPFEPITDLTGSEKVVEVKTKHSGNFDEHIAKSIPTFYEDQIKKAKAIADVYGETGARVLDIAASEGSFGKAISELTNGKVETVSLDPNPDMAAFFESKSKVPGAEYSQDSFLNGFTDEGVEHPAHKPAEPYDVVTESMGFQFIDPDRAPQIAEVKKLLKPDGVFLTEQKVRNPDWAANEKKKDEEYKAKYFSGDELKQKDTRVGFAQSKDEAKSVGMVNNMADQTALEKILIDNFEHVVQYWDSGNFKGYAAGDNAAKVNEIVSAIGDNKSEFSTVDLPRTVKPEAQFAPKKKEKDPLKFLGTQFDSASKAWILPSGKVEQLGAQWHHDWLDQNSEVQKKYGLKIPAFEGGDAEGVREQALRKGFARVNLDGATLIVEAREKDWKNLRPIVEDMIEKNLDDIDKFRVNLLNDGISRITKTYADKLFDADSDKEKMGRVYDAFSESPQGEIGRGVQFAPKGGGEEQEQLFGGREYVSPANFTQEELRVRYPEAIVPKNSKEKIASDIIGSPLYKKSENPVQAFADKLVEFVKKYESNPVYQLGLRWYSDFAPMLKKEFGKYAPMMAELLAASSPNEKPDQNFYYAVDALEGFKSGRFDGIVEKFNQGFDLMKSDKWLAWYNKELNAGKIPNPPQSPTPEAFMAHWILKHNLKPRQSNGQLFGFHGRAILEVMARKWLDQNEGPKVANFVQNLQGTGHEATIDVWADRTMRRVGYEDYKDRWRILPANGEGVSDADFAFAQKAFRRAAEQLGIQPDALQGGLWFAEKQLWADNGWGRLDLGSYVNEMAKLPLIRQAIKQRLSATEKRATIKPMESREFELDIQPRQTRK